MVRGNVIANVINPMTGEIAADIYAPTDGIIFYAQNAPMIYQNSVVFKLIRQTAQLKMAVLRFIR